MSDYPEAPAAAQDDPLGGGWGTAPASAAPEYDPTTGEMLEVVEAELLDDSPLDTSTEQALMPTVFATQGARAVALFRDPEAVQALTHGAKTQLLAKVRGMAEAQRAQRPEGRPTSSGLAPELTLMADAYDTLSALTAVFKAGADEAKSIAGEVTHELADDPRKGSTSVRVGDSHGTDLKVTRTQPTKVQVQEDEIIDVLVASLVASSEFEAEAAVTYARGAREAIALYRTITASHTFKTTALDEWGRELDAAEEHALGIRLGHAYGRVAHGNAQVKIERTERKGKAEA